MDLQWDLKIFKERLSDLISEKLQFFDYNPTNDAWLRNKGAEIEVVYGGLKDIKLGLSYGYLDSETNNFFERSIYSRHVGSFYAIYDISGNVSISGAYYGASSISGFAYDRFDLGLIKMFKYETNKYGELGVLFQHLRNDLGFIVDDGFSVENRFDERNHVTLSLRFGL